jgi:hypothetical protein
LLSEYFVRFDLRHEEVLNSERIIFADFMLGRETEGNRPYLQIKVLSDLLK